LGATEVALQMPEDSVLEFTLGQAGDAISVAPPAWGSMVRVGDRRYAYTPSADGNGTLASSYQRCNGGQCASAPLTITVLPVNDSPTASDTRASTREDTPVTVNVLARAGDVDGDSLAVSGVVALGGGTATVTSGQRVRHTPAPDASGPEVVRYMVVDGKGGGATAFLTTTVTPVNDPPSFSAGADELVPEDAGPQSVPGWATGISAGPADESGQTVTFSVGTDDPSLFSTQPAVSPAGTLTYTPAPDANGIATVTVTATDDGGTANGGDDTSPGQIADITIAAVNDDPVASDDAYSTDEGVALAQGAVGGLLDDDDDPDGDPLVVDTSPVTPPADGVLTLFADGSFDYVPDPDFAGVDSFAYRIDDGAGGTDTATVTITVDPVNDPPSFTIGADELVPEDAGPQSVPVWVTGISAGPADESGQTVTFSVEADDPSLFSTQPAVSPAGTLTYTPAPDANGTATVTVTATDDGGTANGGNDTSPGQIADITVSPVPDPPVLEPIGDRSGAVSRPLLFTAQATDPDGDGLVFTLEDGPGALPAGAAIDPVTGVFTWTPAAGQDGTWVFDVVVTDDSPAALEDRETITVTVTPSIPLEVATGEDHTCHTVSDRTLRCTGSNVRGQLGTGDFTSTTNTVPVLGPAGPGLLSGVTDVAAGSRHTCAVLTAGTAWCWGHNDDGELGNGTLATATRPQRVRGVGGFGFLRDVARIDAGEDHTCALTTNGSVFCWGWNSQGQLGDGTYSASITPVQVVGPGGLGVLTGVTDLSVGNRHTCAVLTDTSVRCWGGNLSATLGIGFPGGSSSVPLQVLRPGGFGFLAGAAEVHAGARHTCARLADGRAVCWGADSSGQIGDLVGGGFRSTPVFVVGPGGVGQLGGVTGLATGRAHSCATRSGDMLCWGADDDGEAGNGPPLAGSQWPVPVSGPGGVGTLNGVVTVFEGSGDARHSCAVRDDDSIWCWGSNGDGQLGDGTTTLRTFPVPLS
jgi:alpha-tubulin suppressor-like RCC1 family protein